MAQTTSAMVLEALSALRDRLISNQGPAGKAARHSTKDGYHCPLCGDPTPEPLDLKVKRCLRSNCQGLSKMVAPEVIRTMSSFVVDQAAVVGALNFLLSERGARRCNMLTFWMGLWSRSIIGMVDGREGTSRTIFVFYPGGASYIHELKIEKQLPPGHWANP